MVTNIVGKRYGRLVVLYPVKNSQNRTAWWTHCDCGEEKLVNTGNLNNGNVQSCRCFQKEVAKKVCTVLGKKRLGIKAKHGHFAFKRRSPEYQSWSGMRDRCENPNHESYRHYGGRGITICKRWRGKHGFLNFLKDMGSRPKGKTLDRKKVNGNYKPSNCRWATSREQALNRRKAIQCFPTADLIAEIKRRKTSVQTN